MLTHPSITVLPDERGERAMQQFEAHNAHNDVGCVANHRLAPHGGREEAAKRRAVALLGCFEPSGRRSLDKLTAKHSYY